ncbi:molecular chaperone, HSP90 family [Longilinea arvoryzae]|uniref:Molecular chaperone, HSP90 family n=1 Tax=Longilinea arvoryzae TaxID=360412 RepID=A0A0S7BDH4_9CHLR|nr:ATP-binding protein [Longilinea arvoryzae]GAP12788.1 molecular chaperone, HSP90 family [Longilinea arvoryzae]
MSTNNATFSGEIKVAARIIDHISSGLYESPAACLKELINNSYDADAKRVDVFLKPDANQIILADDGIGLNKTEFQRHFDRISESHKRETSDITESGRPKIGKIGIGFIAANEICNVMEIESTKQGSSELLKVTINFGEMRKDPAQRRIEGSPEISKADYFGTVEEAPIDDHYTYITLKNIIGDARKILEGAGISPHSSGNKTLYGLQPESINKILGKGPKSWKEFDSYSENMLSIALNVPVRYFDNWPGLENKYEFLDDISAAVKRLDFSAFIDGTELRKPIVFEKEKVSIIREFNYQGEHISARGYFYAQHGIIYPSELRGILIRVRGAAVGGYDGEYMKFSPTTAALFQNWISAEIYADDRLEDAMVIDRKTFRITHEAYVELQLAVHQFLSTFISSIRTDIYNKQGEIRKIEQARVIETRITEQLEEASLSLPLEEPKQITQSWTGATTETLGRSQLLKKYSIDEIYEIILDIGKEFLSSDQLAKFVEKLTKRFRG